MANTTISRRISKTVRSAAGQSGTPYPIEIVAGNSAPVLTGESWHYETKGGRRIYHPSAYSRSGWSNMVYCHSTHAIQVGREWLAAHGLADLVKPVETPVWIGECI